jgi:sugar O-acyltransferase (sialic acid O-acetyltransferase NeuD family)
MTSRKNLVLFGLGELAEVAAYYFEHDTNHTVVAITADGEFIEEDRFLDYPVVPFEDIAKAFPSDDCQGFVSVGYSKINGLRQEKCEAFRNKNYQLASYISTRATTFENVTFGWNNFILEDNTVQPFVTIGNGVTLWSGNHIGHHASIADFAFISSHVVVSGGVTVGERTFIGVNSTINDHVSIGARCVIGSGSLIAKELADDSVTSSEPARLSKVPSYKLRGF